MFCVLGGSSERLSNIMEAHLRPFAGLFGFNRFEVTDGNFYNGTIFRFPLRTSANAAKSEIRKNNPYSSSEGKELLEITRKYGSLLLLFTQFVEKFTIYIYEKEADAMRVYKDCCYRRSVRPFPPQGTFSSSYPQVLQGSSDQFNRMYRVVIDSSESVSTYIVSVCAPGEHSSDKTRCVGAVALNMEGPNAAKNHLFFCFLPIPQPADTELPFMVNGTFAITSSRRQIEIQTMDDKADDSKFNKIILEKAVPKALMNVLSAFARLNSESETLDYFPTTSKKEANIHLVVKEFYRLVVSSHDLKAFETPNGKVALAESRVKIVSPELPGDVKKEIVAFFFKNNSTQSQMIILDMPSSLLDALKKHQPNFLHSKTVDLSTVLPEIISSVNADNVTSISALLNYVLGESDCLEAIKDVLQLKPWILSQDPSGILKRPCDLINPEGNAYHISKELKECLISPAMKFSAERVRTLFPLGMPENGLPMGMFAKLFTRLQTKTNKEFVLEEFRKIVKFLEETPKFDDREWASVLEIPLSTNLSSIKWFKPQDCYEESLYENLVGLTHHSVSFESLGINRKGIVSQKLDLWRAPDNKIVIENALKTTEVDNLNERIRKLKNIFNFLDNMVSDPSDILNSLKEAPIIPTSTAEVFKQAKDVAVEDCPALKDHLYTIHAQMKNSTVKRFLIKKLGAHDKFSAKTYSKALCRMKNEIITDELASQVIEILKYLQHLGPKCCRGSICIPTSQRKMDFPDKMCFGFEEETDYKLGFEVQFCHQDIPPALAKAFSVRTLRQLELDHVSNNVHLKPFGQYEKLTNRLSGIVKDYSSDLDIFKEMLQNADDAGATECDFIFDQRNLTTENLVDESWEKLQGPSLVVFNNAPFTTQDIDGIQCLGESSKSDDVLKIGQYGVGFNCVYKFTDTPCFVTQLDGRGSGVLCLLDPDYQIVKRTGFGSTPGAYLDLSPDFIKRRNGTFDSFMLEKYDILNAKTLFRLPLRKIKSDIAAYCPTSEDMNKIFTKFCDSLNQMVLFVNIKKVRVLTIAEDGTEFVLRQVSREVAAKNEGEHEEWKQNFKTLKSSSPMSLDYNVILIDEDSQNRTTQQKWTIMEHVGSNEAIPDSVLSVLGSRKMSSLNLHAAVAFRHPLGLENKQETPKLYCHLPLPDSNISELIDLPVAINGPFSLDASRRRVLLENNTSSHKWNLYVLENLVGECYANFVSQAAQNLIATKSHYKDFMKLLPSSDQTRFPPSCVAFYICKGLFKHLAVKSGAFVPVLDVEEKMKGLALPKDVFYFSKKNHGVLYALAVELNLPITQLNLKYGRFWRICGLDIKALSANQIINVLPRVIATPCAISSSVLKNKDTLLLLLELACKEDQKFFQKAFEVGLLPSYPIFLTQNGDLHRGNESTPIFSWIEEAQVIFPQLCSSIIDLNVESCLRNAFFFPQFTVNDFLSYIRQYYPHLCMGRDVPLTQANHEWLSCVWRLLRIRGKEEINLFIKDFKRCSILPCLNSRNKTVLIPINKTKAVFNKKTITVGLACVDISSIQAFYFFYKDHLAQSEQELIFLKNFIPDDEERLQDPKFMLEVLHRVYLFDNFKQVSSTDRQHLLEYFVKNWRKLTNSKKCIDALSQLPIHPNLEDTHVSLPQNKEKFCLSDKVPKAGLLDKVESNGFSYFKAHNKEFQVNLGVIHQEDERFYVEFAIPFAFQFMSTENLFKHLEFLNNYYTPKINCSSQSALSALTPTLSNASFVRVSPKCFRQPKELHSPQIAVFQNFVEPESLVPEEYMNKFEFLMNSLDIQKVVTEKHFRRFCEELVHKVIECGCFNDRMKEQSMCLLNHAPKEVESQNDLPRLEQSTKDEIVLSKETLENFSKLEIFWDVDDGPVSLKEAFHNKDLPLVSLVAKVLHSDVSQLLPDSCNALQLRGRPEESLIFSNIEKLASLLKSSLEKENKENGFNSCQKQCISHIKICIEEFSNRKNISAEIKSKLESCECVLTSKERLSSPNLFCIALPRDTFSGMKNYIDTCHPEFFSILKELKTLGAQPSVTVKQIQVGLTKVYKDFVQGEKDPNFQKTVKYMVELFFKIVIEHPGDVKNLLSRTPLYLLSTEGTLESANNLCYFDKDASPECRKRWNKNGILHISDDRSGIRSHFEKFPLPHCVVKMSSLIKTSLDQDTYDESNITQANWLKDLKTTLESSVSYEMLAGYLIYAQVMSGERKELARQLKNEVGKKKYVFCNKIFLMRESVNGNFTAFTDESQTVWDTGDRLIFATTIIGSEQDLKDKIIECVLMPLCQKVDAKKLKTLFFECATDKERKNWLSEITGDEVTTPLYYQAGDDVPQDLHALLDQDPVDILEEGVLVALLEKGSLDDEDASFKFAKVIRTLQEPKRDGNPPDFGLYELDVGKEHLHSFKGIDIFVFKSSKKNTSTDSCLVETTSEDEINRDLFRVELLLKSMLYTKDIQLRADESLVRKCRERLISAFMEKYPEEAPRRLTNLFDGLLEQAPILVDKKKDEEETTDSEESDLEIETNYDILQFRQVSDYIIKRQEVMQKRYAEYQQRKTKVNQQSLPFELPAGIRAPPSLRYTPPAGLTPIPRVTGNVVRKHGNAAKAQSWLQTANIHCDTAEKLLESNPRDNACQYWATKMHLKVWTNSFEENKIIFENFQLAFQTYQGPFCSKKHSRASSEQFSEKKMELAHFDYRAIGKF